MSDRRPELIRAAIEAFNRGDVPGVLELIHPEVKARIAEGLGNPGSFDGHEGYLAMMADWAEAWSENRLELIHVELVDGRTALVHTAQTAIGAGSGIPLDFETVFLVTFSGDKAVRFEIHPDRDSALAAL